MSFEHAISKRQVADAFRTTKERQQLAFDAAQLGYWIYEFAGEIVECDNRAQIHFGVPAVVQASGLLSRVHPDDRAAALQRKEEILAGQPASYVEYRIRHADGSWHWIALHSRIEYADYGARAARAIGTSQDITERKKSEQALIDSEALLRSATDSSGVALVVLDRNRRYTFTNRAYAGIVGYDGDLVGKSAKEMLGTRYATEIAPRLDRAFNGERVCFEYSRSPDPNDSVGKLRLYSVIFEPQLDAGGQVANVIVVIFEITDLRRSEEALRASEARLRGIYERAIAGIAIVDSGRQLGELQPRLVQDAWV